MFFHCSPQTCIHCTLPSASTNTTLLYICFWYSSCLSLVFLQTEVTQLFGTFIQVFELAKEEMGNLPCFQEAVLHLCIKQVYPQQAWIIIWYPLNRQYLIDPLKNKKIGNLSQCLVTSISAGIKHQGLLEHCLSCTGW